MKIENQQNNNTTMTQNDKTYDQYLNSTLTPTNSTANLNGTKRCVLSTKLSRQNSLANRNNYRLHSRQSLNTSNDFLIHHTSYRGIPVVIRAITKFFQATKIMEDEIMIPSKLRDTPVEENLLDSSIQPNNWHEVFKFVQDIRNQLQCSRPFSDNNHQDNNIIHNDNYVPPSLISDNENGYLTNFSSASSTTSEISFEGDNNYAMINTSSFEAITEELKYHYYSLIDTLDILTFLANRVTEKYREDGTFK
ncbi:unnamed protein product [Didymodactylos carnosus]|uniref:Uncharacterized protein n=1 Tax=Didymodactylos carnosus TaxID=1234261 RepID=A0A815XV35_9BILA|nr:unnamed protein product [Didymodactylos carnosus]CAF1561912.1 unnamed protein product [Didymodactylos carnosus]CAF3886354.1 unnamed protein product [Didymodactylos carnosus]CAF4423466.1 unnamed protein product [Didymodactylos carnosus]